MKKIFIATDHRGTDLKNKILELFPDLIDLSGKYDPEDDYPDFAFKLGEEVVKNNSRGILICGSGNGMCIAANKVKGVRATKVSNVFEAGNCVQENGVNVIVLKEDLDINLIKDMINSFIEVKEPYQERHIRRINKIINYENGEYNVL